jgi:tol-pal system protein YbgF
MKTTRAILAAAILPLLAGCVATKRDLEDLRFELQTSRAAQQEQMDRLIRRIEAQLDSMELRNNRLRGDISNRLVAIERQLVQIQELSGQSQAQLTELRRQINQRAEEARRAAEAEQAADTTDGGGGEAGGATADQAQEVYDAALGAFRRNSLSTARSGFEEFLRVAPRHRLAADAQFYIGETYAREPDRAVESFERVVEQYPSSSRAPTALLRIARIEAERDNRDEARARYNQILRAYPRSPEAEQARTALARLGRG